MAESSIGMSQTDITAIKEALCTQQQLLQKLYNELDLEREASATSASEALSMILRLQGEKAAVKLEAEQYKRLAEEKMCLAEESLTIFEDLMYQKEMEIAALDYQVQAYRYKLLGMGCVDPGVGEIKFPENLLQRNENLSRETSVQCISRRSSEPSISLKFSYLKKGIIKRERSTSPEIDLIEKIMKEHVGQEVNDQILDLEKKSDSSYLSGYINSYSEQIRKLDEHVKEIAGDNYENSRDELRSSYDQQKEVIINELDRAKNRANINESTADSACSSSVHDVFEVPQDHENQKDCGYQMKEQCNIVSKGDEKNEKPDFVTQEDLKSYIKDQTDGLKKMMLSLHRENTLCRHSDGVAVDGGLAIVRPAIGVLECNVEIQQPNRQSEITEVESEAIDRKEEELQLLNEIREQLNSIQFDIRSWKTKKSSKPDDLPLAFLAEAMLHFWL